MSSIFGSKFYHQLHLSPMLFIAIQKHQPRLDRFTPAFLKQSDLLHEEQVAYCSSQ